MGMVEAREGCKEQIRGHLSVVAAGHPLEQVGESYQTLCDAFQGLGICDLLLDMDQAEYRANLKRSGYVRRFFLRKVAEHGAPDRVFVALSRTEALFDALACADWRLVSDLYRLSPAQWMPEGEYEDEYAYHRFVHECVQCGLAGAPDLSATDPWLTLLEAEAGSDMGGRVDLCRSYRDGVEVDFWKALADRIDELQMSDPQSVLEQEFCEAPWELARASVSVEAVAWVHLANVRGWQPPYAFALCPQPALAPAQPSSLDDFTLELETTFGL